MGSAAGLSPARGLGRHRRRRHTGESPALSLAEIEELTRRAVARCRGRLKVIVGAGTNSTQSTISRTRALSRLGVDAVMLVTPYYNKPPQEGLFKHFAAAADASAAR